MEYIETTVRTNTAGAELVADILMEAGAKGTSIEDRADVADLGGTEGMWDMVDEVMLASMDEDVLVKAYFRADCPVPERLSLISERLEALKKQAGLDYGKLSLETEAVRDEDWAETWKQYYKPMKPGKRIVIKPSWEPYAPQSGEAVVEIDPGMAFGTGTHETTTLCLLGLEDYLAPSELLIDVGTGTGILAIAGAKLGAQDVLAIDLDADAVLVAFENVKKNGVEDTVRVVAGDLLKQREERADVVVANIIADVIIALSGPVREHLLPGGRFISSGIIKDRAEDVETALQTAGYTVLEKRERGEWVCFISRL